MEKRFKPFKELNKLTPGELTDYIENHYHKSLKSRMSRLEELIDKVHRVHKAKFDESLSFFKTVFTSFKEELEEHLEKEEKVLFPYIRKVTDFSEGKGHKPVPPEGTVKTIINHMEKYEHKNSLNSLKEIMELAGDYALPDFNCLIFPLLHEGLKKLEKDLYEHISLENKVLYPGTIELEEKLKISQ